MAIGKRRVGYAVAALALCLYGAGEARSQGVPAHLQVGSSGGLAQVDLAWTADPGTFYEIWSTTNLAAGPWTLAVEDPVNATNLVGQMQILSTDKTRFFQVRLLDTQGPEIVSRYPGVGAVGVGRAAQLSVLLADPSGTDSNAFRLAVNGGAPLLWNSPGVDITASRFDYDPADVAAEWGPYGVTVTVSFACADLKGNATSAEWSFVLEVEPQVAGNLLHLPAPAPVGGGPVRLAMPPPPDVVFLAGLEIVEFLPDRIVFSYAGEHGLSVGAILVSHDPDRPFYRRILSLESGPGGGQVTAFTEDVLLTDIVQEGSFSPEAFIPVGGQPLPLWGDADLGLGVRFGTDFGFSLAELEWEDGVRLENVSVTGRITGGFGMACEIRNWQFAALEVAVENAVDVTIRSDLAFWGGIAYTNTLWSSPAIPLGKVVGFIGPVPAWLDVNFGLKLELECEAEVALTVENLGVQAHIGSRYGMRWTPDGIVPVCAMELGVQPLPFTWEGGVDFSASAYLYAKPYISAMLYSVVGVTLDYRRGPSLEAEWRFGEPQAQFSLFDKSSLNGELTIVGVDPAWLPTVKFFEEKNPLLTYYWPEIPLAAPAFTLHPSGGAYASGAAVTLTASASGNPAPSYQWYQNGSSLIGRTGQTLVFTMGASAAGSYYCRAANNRGTATSQSATISLPASAPVGMALIPAGSFQMGDNLGDGWDGELPVHTVYVSAFYMDRTEVTWGKWKEVRAWAAASGYDIGSVGAGKADSHPVLFVNWYDCVKWLNARSQMEGLAPCYKRGGSVYKAEQHDDIVCDWSANGYRLPTEAEWEKAARGGLSGRRFPWGDTISHGRANYFAVSSCIWYDTNGYDGYHPAYTTGGMPYTSPVGAFAANGYGLYDMTGNLWEWCWDWFDNYPSGSVSNPCGPSSPSPNWGLVRAIRGGCWTSGTSRARVAIRFDDWPDGPICFVGFRSVRPQVQ